MQINKEYATKLLIAIVEAKNPTTNITELKTLGFDYVNDGGVFLLHIEYLRDQGYVKGKNGDLGVVRGADGKIAWCVVPISITPQGREYLNKLLTQHSPCAKPMRGFVNSVHSNSRGRI